MGGLIALNTINQWHTLYFTRLVSPNTRVFLKSYNYGGKADITLLQGLLECKKKLGVTTHFSEISNNNSKKC